MPESVLTYFEAARDRMSVLEKHIQEDQEKNSKTWDSGFPNTGNTGSPDDLFPESRMFAFSDDASWSDTYVTCQSEDLVKDLTVSADDDPIALKERVSCRPMLLIYLVTLMVDYLSYCFGCRY